MCLIIFVVFAALCVNSYMSSDFLNMAIYGVIAIIFGLFFGYRIYKNRKCIFGKCEK